MVSWDYLLRPERTCIPHDRGIVLEMLAVHPHFQRLGAGTALVKWGTNAADEQGLKVKDVTCFFFLFYIIKVLAPKAVLILYSPMCDERLIIQFCRQSLRAPQWDVDCMRAVAFTRRSRRCDLKLGKNSLEETNQSSYF